MLLLFLLRLLPPLDLAGRSRRLGAVEGQMPGYKVIAAAHRLLLLLLALCCTRCIRCRSSRACCPAFFCCCPCRRIYWLPAAHFLHIFLLRGPHRDQRPPAGPQDAQQLGQQRQAAPRAGQVVQYCYAKRAIAAAGAVGECQPVGYSDVGTQPLVGQAARPRQQAPRGDPGQACSSSSSSSSSSSVSGGAVHEQLTIQG